MGIPYVWGGEHRAWASTARGSPMLAWRQAGVYIPRTADIQYGDQPRPAHHRFGRGTCSSTDLDGDGIDHVVMYVGSGPYGANHHPGPPRPARPCSTIDPALHLRAGRGAGRP